METPPGATRDRRHSLSVRHWSVVTGPTGSCLVDTYGFTSCHYERYLYATSDCSNSMMTGGPGTAEV